MPMEFVKCDGNELVVRFRRADGTLAAEMMFIDSPENVPGVMLHGFDGEGKYVGFHFIELPGECKGSESQAGERQNAPQASGAEADGAKAGKPRKEPEIMGELKGNGVHFEITATSLRGGKQSVYVNEVAIKRGGDGAEIICALSPRKNGREMVAALAGALNMLIVKGAIGTELPAEVKEALNNAMRNSGIGSAPKDRMWL